MVKKCEYPLQTLMRPEVIATQPKPPPPHGKQTLPSPLDGHVCIKYMYQKGGEHGQICCSKEKYTPGPGNSRPTCVQVFVY